MAKEIKFTEEEIIEIEDIKQQSGLIYQRLGQLAVEEKRRLEEVSDAKNELHEELNNLRNTETKLFTSLNEKYGDGNYDPTTNVFTPLTQENPGQSTT